MGDLRTDLVNTLMEDMGGDERQRVHGLLHRFGDQRPVTPDELGPGVTWGPRRAAPLESTAGTEQLVD